MGVVNAVALCYPTLAEGIDMRFQSDQVVRRG